MERRFHCVLVFQAGPNCIPVRGRRGNRLYLLTGNVTVREKEAKGRIRRMGLEEYEGTRTHRALSVGF